MKDNLNIQNINYVKLSELLKNCENFRILRLDVNYFIEKFICDIQGLDTCIISAEVVNYVLKKLLSIYEKDQDIYYNKLLEILANIDEFSKTQVYIDVKN